MAEGRGRAAKSLTAEPTSAALRIEYLPLASIARFDRNPKKHDVGALVQSIRRYGFRDAPIFDGTLKALVAGHGRLKALEAMQGEGDQAPPGIKLNGGGEWLVPLQLGVDAKSAAEAQAFLVDHNALTVAGGDMGVEGILRMYDQDALGALLKEAAEAGEMPVTLDGDDLDQLLNGGSKAAVEDDPSELIDRSEELRQKWETKPGQLWALGAHRVLCGDSTKVGDVERLLGGATPTTMLTDPPYCSGGFQEAGRSAGSIGTDAKVKRSIANDTLSSRGYAALLKAVIGLAPVSLLYIFTDWRMWVVLFDVAESSGYGVRNMIVWDKGSPGMGVGWRTQHELVLYATNAKVKWDNHKAQGNVIATSRTGNPLHPTQKPVELLAKILEVTDVATEVYDPFLGSGSTLVAAEQAGRPCYAMDIAPQYVAVTLQRWASMTGGEPRLVS